MSLMGSLGKTLYHGATSRVGAGLIIGGAALTGMAKIAAPAARDAAMDVAFGDPDADKYFTGRKLGPGVIADSMFPGGNSGKAAIALGGLGTLTGAAIGGGIGSLMGRGVRGAIAGGIAGGIGMPLMAATGYINRNKEFMMSSPYSGNRRLDRKTMEYIPWSQPRNTSSQNASELNATGDVVLGMHNRRRG
jgi:hypothetical protein